MGEGVGGSPSWPGRLLSSRGGAAARRSCEQQQTLRRAHLDGSIRGLEAQAHLASEAQALARLGGGGLQLLPVAQEDIGLLLVGLLGL